MGGGGSRVEYVTNTVYHVPAEVTQQLEKQKSQIDQLETEAKERNDPTHFTKNAKDLVDNLAKELPKLNLTSFINKKTGEHHVGFIGPVSAGKTSCINALFGLKLPVAMSHCTETCDVVHVKGLNIIWDVFGSSNTLRFYDPESLAFIKDLDVSVLLFCDDIDMISDMLKIIYSINKRVVIVRTKADLYSEDDARTIEQEQERDTKKANEVLGTTDIKTYCISSRNVAKNNNQIFDWKAFEKTLGLID